MRLHNTLALTLALLAAPISAEEAYPDAPPPPPMLPEEVYSQIEQGAQPQVTIRKRGGQAIEEYRINGMLYMVKITPSKGRPYYLMDSDGDGSLETRRNSLEDPEVVKWRIFSW